MLGMRPGEGWAGLPICNLWERSANLLNAEICRRAKTLKQGGGDLPRAGAKTLKQLTGGTDLPERKCSNRRGGSAGAGLPLPVSVVYVCMYL